MTNPSDHPAPARGETEINTVIEGLELVLERRERAISSAIDAVRNAHESDVNVWRHGHDLAFAAEKCAARVLAAVEEYRRVDLELTEAKKRLVRPAAVPSGAPSGE